MKPGRDCMRHKLAEWPVATIGDLIVGLAS